MTPDAAGAGARLLVSQLSQAAALAEGAGLVVTAASPAFERLAGGDAVGRPLSEALSTEGGRLADAAAGVRRTGEPYRARGVVLQAEGTVRATVDVECRPFRGEGGEVLGVLVELVEMAGSAPAGGGAGEEGSFQALADTIPQLAWMADPDGSITWFNRRWYEYTGAAPGEMVGWGWRAVHHPDHLARVEERFRAAIDAGAPWEDTFPLRGADGGYRWFLSRALPLRDERGRVVRWFGTNTDVQEQLRAEGERDRALAQAEEARREAEEANRAKSEFLASMSHEIRTPINAIVGYTELLEMGLAGPLTDRQREQLARVRASGAHLLGLVNEILDLARVESGRMELEQGRGDVLRVAADALALVETQAAGHGIELRNECAGDCEYVFAGDENRVRQVLLNLLSNAVKFTDRGGRVTVSAEVARHPEPGARLSGPGPWTCIRVADTGIGIAPEQQESIFEPFVQAESGFTRTRGGTGLGLAISRRLARLMGGDLTVASRPGEGSAFTLWLPGDVGAPAEEPGERAVSESLVRMGEAMHDEVNAIVEAYVARMREDPGVPLAAPLERVELEDHVASFLADAAQTLVVLGRTGGEPQLMRDGSEIQRLVSERHGAQRARLGWTEEALRREYRLLGAAAEAALRRRCAGEPRAGLEDAVAVVSRLLDRAEQLSLRALRGVRAEAAGEPPGS